AAPHCSPAENTPATVPTRRSSDLDAITSVTATEGTITFTNSSWSWSESAPLADGLHTVTITVKNADNSTGTTSFTFTPTDVAPTTPVTAHMASPHWTTTATAICRI